MNERQKLAFMDMAFRISELSYAIRTKVGALAVKDGRIISMGYNGTLPGRSNNCERIVGTMNGVDVYNTVWSAMYANSRQALLDVHAGKYPGLSLETVPELLHAEQNLIAHLAKAPESSEGCSVFLTMMPCVDCAKMMIACGVKEIYYRDEYRLSEGVALVKSEGIKIERI